MSLRSLCLLCRKVTIAWISQNANTEVKFNSQTSENLHRLVRVCSPSYHIFQVLSQTISHWFQSVAPQTNSISITQDPGRNADSWPHFWPSEWQTGWDLASFKLPSPPDISDAGSNVGGTALSIWLPPTRDETGRKWSILTVLHKRQQKFREVKWLTKHHTADWQNKLASKARLSDSRSRSLLSSTQSQ